MIKFVVAVLSIIITIGGGYTMFFGKKSCLGTNECGIDIADINGRNLNLKVVLANSGMKFTKYEVERKNDSAFISIYSTCITSDDLSKPPITGAIQYLIPDGVNKVYLRGNTSDDLKTLWKNK